MNQELQIESQFATHKYFIFIPYSIVKININLRIFTNISVKCKTKSQEIEQQMENEIQYNANYRKCYKH